LRELGVSQWALFSLAQAIGMLFSMVVDFGFSWSGPAKIGALEYGQRIQFYSKSFEMRLLLLIILFPFACLMFDHVSPKFDLGYYLVILGYMVQSLSASWFFIGNSNSSAFFYQVSFPKSMAFLVGVLLVVLFNSIVPLALLLICAGAISSYYSYKSILKNEATKRIFHGFTFNVFFRELRMNFSELLATSLGSVLSQSPIVLVSYFRPNYLEIYALGDRIIKFGVGFLSPLVQWLQSWVFESRDKLNAHRKLMLGKFLPLSVLPIFVLAFLGMPYVSNFLSDGELSLGYANSAAFASIGALSFSTWILGSILLQDRSSKHINSIAVSVSVLTLVILFLTPMIVLREIDPSWLVAISYFILVTIQMISFRVKNY
jgi:O-antigen/teichoic acid export membrane protein